MTAAPQGGQTPTPVTDADVKRAEWVAGQVLQSGQGSNWLRALLEDFISRRTPTGRVAEVAKDRWLAEETRRVMGLSHGNVLREWIDRTGSTIGPDNEISIQMMRNKLMRLAVVEDAARAASPSPTRQPSQEDVK